VRVCVCVWGGGGAGAGAVVRERGRWRVQAVSCGRPAVRPHFWCRHAWMPRVPACRQHALLLCCLRCPPPTHTHTHTGLPRQGEPHVLLTTYKMVQSLNAQALARYQVVICDESHRLKNHEAQQCVQRAGAAAGGGGGVWGGAAAATAARARARR
jgi:hypothetical protein